LKDLISGFDDYLNSYYIIIQMGFLLLKFIYKYYDFYLYRLDFFCFINLLNPAPRK